ncbi:biotin--[acetyl-CoA-carboxylase] ligase [Candidatus Parcubacteria bacterium]|nr:biotin--[acetyl-CoA-carboxylase] ligase [Candidatus Parcubacteria bacterium]
MKILFFKELLSTSKKAKEIANEVEPWTVVVAESQNAGYGKKKRGWFSPSGGLYFSIIIKPEELEELQLLTFAAGIAVAKVINEKFKIKACLKWPNDVLIEERKVCGILTESVIRGKMASVVVGIGIDTNIEKFPPELANTATSLKVELKEEVNNKEILDAVLKELRDMLKKNATAIAQEYRLYENTLGKKIKVVVQGKEIYGKAFDFDQKGDLIVKLKDKQTIKILEGEVTYNF